MPVLLAALLSIVVPEPAMPRIHSIKIENFAAIERAEIAFDDVTLLFGRNEAGKTSVIDALYFVLTGESSRGVLMQDLVKQGAKRMEVELLVDTGQHQVQASILRWRQGAKTEVAINGEVLAKAAASAAIAAVLGGRLDAWTTALRSGDLLSLKRDELLEFVQRLTGVQVDAATIQAALGEPVLKDLAAVRMQPPKSLSDFDVLEKRAEAEWQEAKRMLSGIEARYVGLPRPEPAGAAVLRELGLARVTAEFDELTRARDGIIAATAATSATRTAQFEALQRRIEEQAAVPIVVADPAHERRTRDELETELRGLAQAEHLAKQLEAEVAALRGLGDPGQGEDPFHLSGALTGVRAKLKDEQTQLEFAASQGKSIAALVTTLRDLGSGSCPTCSRPMEPGFIERLEESLKGHRESWVMFAEIVNKTAAELQGLEARAATLARVQELRRKLERLPVATTELEHATAQVTAVRIRVDQLRRAADEARAMSDAGTKSRRAREEQRRLEAELEKLAKPAPVVTANLADVDARLVHLNSAIDASAKAAAIVKVQDEEHEVSARIETWDRIRKAAGPKGARLALVTRLVQPLLEAANRALALLAPGTAVDVETSKELQFVVSRAGTTCSVEQLSDGARTRLLYVLQYAVAHLARASFVAFDRAELLDEQGRAALKGLAVQAASEGIQIVLLSCLPPVSHALPAGVTGFVLAAGSSLPLVAPAAA